MAHPRTCAIGFFLLLLGVASCAIVEVEDPPGIAEAGDPCVEPGSYACTEDEGTELICEDGWFVVSQACPGGCTIETGTEGQDEVVCLASDGSLR